jgi:hypothetical protein
MLKNVLFLGSTFPTGSNQLSQTTKHTCVTMKKNNTLLKSLHITALLAMVLLALPITVRAAAIIYEPFADSEATLTGNTPGTGLTGTYGFLGTSCNQWIPRAKDDYSRNAVGELHHHRNDRQ